MSVSRYFLRPAPSLPADFRVELGTRPAADLIVSRATGGYLDPGKLIAAYERINEASRRLGVPMPGKLSGASQDDPEVVPLSRCRYDFTLEVPAGTKALPGLHAARREGALPVNREGIATAERHQWEDAADALLRGIQTVIGG